MPVYLATGRKLRYGRIYFEDEEEKVDRIKNTYTMTATASIKTEFLSPTLNLATDQLYLDAIKKLEIVIGEQREEKKKMLPTDKGRILI